VRLANIAAQRAKDYDIATEAGVFGTVGGKPVPGAMVDAYGRPIGSRFSTNIRPTAAERRSADLGGSAIEQIDDMEDIIVRRPDIFGPASGRYTKLNVWLGSQDPDAQAFRAAAETSGGHLAGVFGSRSAKVIDGILNVAGDFSTNPDALIAGLDQFREAAENIQQHGIVRTATPGGGGPGSGGNKPAASTGDLAVDDYLKKFH
jgi:hypothetical protein